MDARRNLGGSLSEVEDVEVPSRPREGMGNQTSPLGNVGKVPFIALRAAMNHSPLFFELIKRHSKRHNPFCMFPSMALALNM